MSLSNKIYYRKIRLVLYSVTDMKNKNNFKKC